MSSRDLGMGAIILSAATLLAASPMPGGQKPFVAKVMPEPQAGSVYPVTIWAKDYIDAKRQLDRQCQKPCRIIEDVREER